MVALLKTSSSKFEATRKITLSKSNRPVFKTAVKSPKPVEVVSLSVLNEEQYEHFTQCMSNPDKPTQKMIQAHKALEQFRATA